MDDVKESEIILETNRLTLQNWTRNDVDALFEIMRDAEVMRFLADGKPFTFEKVLEFLIWAENIKAKTAFVVGK